MFDKALGDSEESVRRMKMERKIILLLFLFIFVFSIASAAVAAEEDIDKYSTAILNISIKGDVGLGSSGKLIAELFLLPQEEKQTVLSSKNWASPSATIEQKQNSVVYSWGSVQEGSFGTDAQIQTKVTMPGPALVPFPPQIKEYTEYTKATENIDINSEIIKKANEIVAGKTDTLKAVTALADFVNKNVVYDKYYISSIKKASWVLQNKRGVCDEYTNLFIALCRSLGLPARYVTGIAYSSEKNDFGNHAWAEVYIPEQGWIPFDPTYEQYGFVDASHVAFGRTTDVRTSVSYSYPADSKITTREITISADIVSKSDKLTPKTSLEIELLANMIKDGMYVPLEVKIRNNEDYYLPFIVYLKKSPEIDGKNSKSMIIAPGEEKSVFFILKTPTEDIEEGYKYESIIEARSNYDDIAQTSILFSKSYEEGFSLENARSIVNALTKETREDNYNLDLSCKGIQTEFYEDEEIKATCKITNTGNVPLDNLKLCIKDNCKTLELAIGKSAKQNFTLSKEKDYLVNAKNAFIEKSDYLKLKILKRPDLKIIGIEQKELDYHDDNINLAIETASLCRNVAISINNQKVTANETELKKDILIKFAGKNALSEKIRVRAKCYDLRGREYNDEKVFDVKVTNIPFLGKIMQFFVKIFS